MSPTDAPTVIALVVSCVVLARLTPGAIRAWQTYSGVSGRRQEDATGRAPAPDGEILRRLAALEAIGYRRIGETWTSTPSGGGFAWVLASADEETYALAAQRHGREAAGLTGFYSTWRDGQWLGTLHPGGSPHTSEGLRIVIETATLTDAEARHRAEVAAMSARHGLAGGSPRSPTSSRWTPNTGRGSAVASSGHCSTGRCSRSPCGRSSSCSSRSRCSRCPEGELEG